MILRYASALGAGAATILLFACSGASSAPAGPDVDSGTTMNPPDAGGGMDSATPPVPDGSPGPADGNLPPPPPGDSGPDGTPTRKQCTNNFGSALTTGFGRMDGYLVSIVPPGTHGCNGDADHVHLQVLMSGSVYDVAIDIHSTMDPNPNVSIDEISHALVGGAWSEGWHTTVSVDYVASLGIHSTQFTETPEAQLATQIETALANVNHVSVYAQGYGPTGCHDVHRTSGYRDGAVVMYPLSSAPQWLVFHFSTQSF
jgi:hypothetical protein